MRNKPQNNGLDYFHSVGTETTKRKVVKKMSQEFNQQNNLNEQQEINPQPSQQQPDVQYVTKKSTGKTVAIVILSILLALSSGISCVSCGTSCSSCMTWATGTDMQNEAKEIKEENKKLKEENEVLKNKLKEFKREYMVDYDESKEYIMKNENSYNNTYEYAKFYVKSCERTSENTVVVVVNYYNSFESARSYDYFQMKAYKDGAQTEFKYLDDNNKKAIVGTYNIDVTMEITIDESTETVQLCSSLRAYSFDKPIDILVPALTEKDTPSV